MNLLSPHTPLSPRESDRLVVAGPPAAGRGGLAVLSATSHLAALALLVRIAVPLPPSPPEAPSFPIFFRAPAPVAPPRATVAPPRAVALPMAPTSEPRAAAPRRPVRRLAVARAAPPIPAAVPAPEAVPRTVAAPVPANEGANLVAFASAIRDVVRAAAVMPAAARAQHREGRAQVQFAYLDGRVLTVALAQSSRSRLLDDAAMSAVRQAHYPPPPPALRGRELPLLVWIDFRMQGPAPG